jgi:serine/threonine protein kinase
MLMIIELLGLPPSNILQTAERRKKFFTDDYSCKIPPSKNREKLKKCMNWKTILGNDCDKSFLDLVKRCLEWDPDKRITPR